MSQQLFINIGYVKSSQKKIESNLITELPQTMLSRRRKSKITARKCNEELIQEAYQQLLSYVDSVENRVQGIIQTHQGQFLEAYKQHVKRLREEMEEIKRKSLNNSNSEQVFIEKIDILEKQLVIFRDESLKLFQKIIYKDKHIDNLQRKINLLQKDHKQQEKSLYVLAKTKKQLQVQVQILKNKVQQYQAKNEHQSHKQSREFSLEQKRNSQILTPVVKHLNGIYIQPRPYTTNMKSQRNKNLSLRLQSASKGQSKELQELNWLKRRLQQKTGGQKLVQIQTVYNLLAEHKTNDIVSKRGSSQDYRSVRNKFVVKLDSKRSRLNQTANRLENYSKQILKNKELKTVFKNCVDQIRKDIIKRNNIPSINFFKENGPKSYEQFKKVDQYSLLQLLIKDQRVLKALYELIFSPQPEPLN